MVSASLIKEVALEKVWFGFRIGVRVTENSCQLCFVLFLEVNCCHSIKLVFVAIKFVGKSIKEHEGICLLLKCCQGFIAHSPVSWSLLDKSSACSKVVFHNLNLKLNNWLTTFFSI